MASLASNEPDHDMDKLLHRGPYAIAGEHTGTNETVAWWQRLFGITKQFNREDRITAYLVIGYFLASLVVFAFGMLYGKLLKPNDDAWANFWHVYLITQIILLVCTTTFLGSGGIRDMLRLFRQLRSNARDFSDDGTVKHESEQAQGVHS